MTRFAPLWQQAGSYAASVDRYLIGALRPVGGCNAAALSLVNNTMNVSVAAGDCVVPLQSGQGSALCHWDAAEVVTLAAAPPSGQTRVDLIVCQVRDNALDAGGNNDFIITAVTGTPSTGFPAIPAAPTNAYALGTCTVGGAVANLNGSQTTYASRASLNSGQVLAVVRLPAAAYQTTSLTYVLVDSAKALLSFTVPGSGAVLLRCSGLWNNGASGVKGLLAWSSAATANTNFITAGIHTGWVDNQQRLDLTAYTSVVMTPGATVTAYLQFGVYGTAGTVSLGNSDDITLEAVAV